MIEIDLYVLRNRIAKHIIIIGVNSHMFNDYIICCFKHHHHHHDGTHTLDKMMFSKQYLLVVYFCVYKITQHDILTGESAFKQQQRK